MIWQRGVAIIYADVVLGTAAAIVGAETHIVTSVPFFVERSIYASSKIMVDGGVLRVRFLTYYRVIAFYETITVDGFKIISVCVLVRECGIYFIETAGKVKACGGCVQFSLEKSCIHAAAGSQFDSFL